MQDWVVHYRVELKILWTERSVRVRVPPPAPVKSRVFWLFGGFPREVSLVLTPRFDAHQPPNELICVFCSPLRSVFEKPWERRGEWTQRPSLVAPQSLPGKFISLRRFRAFAISPRASQLVRWSP